MLNVVKSRFLSGKKSIFSVPVYIVILYLVVSLISCDKENPIVPPPPSNPLVIDSNFFDWHIDTARGTLGGLQFGMYIADTNRIFISGTIYGIFFDNGTLRKIKYLDNDPNFKAYCVNGTNVNNVYFGGAADDGTQKSKLKIWNGNYIKDIDLPDDSSARILSIEVISDNDIWMSTDHNVIYHYNTLPVTSYKLETGLKSGMIQKDNYGNLFAYYIKNLPEMNNLFYIFKYENNNWIQIYKDSTFPGSELTIGRSFVNNQCIRKGLTGYYYFTGNNWQKFLNLGGLIYGHACGGKSFDNILLNGFEEGVGLGVFYYDGKQIYRQPYYYLPEPAVFDIQYKFGRYYLLMEDWDFFQAYLGIATFKKTNSQNFKQE
jgi:hypothetical protein